jgi:hypothetical protein
VSDPLSAISPFEAEPFTKLPKANKLIQIFTDLLSDQINQQLFLAIPCRIFVSLGFFLSF